jgi:uncharacterized membrane protein (UPF0127 family)
VARFLVLFAVAFVCSSGFGRDLDKLYEKAQLQIGKHKIDAYVADDESRREQGLMFIEKLAPDSGMLFVFDDERPLAFWMKNTLIPLSIGYFDASGTLVDVQEMKPAATLLTVDSDQRTYPSARPSVFALEMGEGWFDKKKIKVGAKLILLSRPKSQLLNEKLGSKGKSSRR